MSRAAIVVLSALVLALTGCSVGSQATSGSTSAHVAAPSGDKPASSAGMRGFPVSSMECSTSPRPQTSSPVAISGAVEMVRLCPPAVGNPSGQVTQVTLTPAGNPVKLNALTSALSLTDEPAPTASRQMCLTIGLVMVEVLIKTADGEWAAFLPRDSCGDVLEPVGRSIGAALA